MIEQHFNKLIKFYSTNVKHYHTIYHVENLLKLWNQYREEFLNEFPRLNEKALLTAIRWHDSFYQPGNSLNEELSICRYMNAYGEQFDPFVCAIIKSTEIGYECLNLASEFKVMHDLDWSGFNNFDEFKENCNKICTEAVELGHFDINVVQQNQINFYRKFAEKPLYLTKTFEKFNSSAKTNMLNLANELEQKLLEGY
jgi:predicted metal-dependent HD superfamily phosphohydrolase